jgi:dihydroorotate dehydrogenase
LDLSLYRTAVRPALFLTSPETAHGIAKFLLARSWIWKILRWHLCLNDQRLQVLVGNLKLSNPVGLAAGFEKNCAMSRALFHMGFGYVTLGTVTLNRRSGNPKPRLFRYPQNSLINSMGFPNEGAEVVARNLSRQNFRHGKMIVSVSGVNTEEFVDCYLRLEPFADAIELNISTPNTEGVRVFQERGRLAKLLDEITRLRSSSKPVWVKLPPYFSERERENVLELVDTCLKESVSALTATNTKRVSEPRTPTGTGGLSGPPIFEDMLRIVADIYNYTQGKIPINACGGISSGLDAWRAFEVGASSVQLYTALIYQGPGIVAKINRTLLAMLASSGSNSLSEVVGTGLR